MITYEMLIEKRQEYRVAKKAAHEDYIADLEFDDLKAEEKMAHLQQEIKDCAKWLKDRKAESRKAYEARLEAIKRDYEAAEVQYVKDNPRVSNLDCPAMQARLQEAQE